MRFFSILFFISIIYGCSSDNKTAADQGIHSAWAYTQLYVEQNLNNPETAEFRYGGYQDVTELGGGRYIVSSYVDAQNALGAKVRTHFEGIVYTNSDGWGVETFNFKK